MPETPTTSVADSDALFLDWLNLANERRRLIADANTPLATNDGVALRMLVERVADYWQRYGALERRIDPDVEYDTAKLADARNSEKQANTSQHASGCFQFDGVWRLQGARRALRDAVQRSKIIRAASERQRLDSQLQRLTLTRHHLLKEIKTMVATPEPAADRVHSLACEVADYYRALGDAERELMIELERVS